jgi:hypothetical protein
VHVNWSRGQYQLSATSLPPSSTRWLTAAHRFNVRKLQSAATPFFTADVMIALNRITCTAALVGTLVNFLLAVNIHRLPASHAAAVTSRRSSSSSKNSSSFSFPSSSRTSASGVSTVTGFKLDLDELQKRGLSPEDVLHHIRLLAEGRITVDGKCLNGGKSPSTGRDNQQRSSRGTAVRYSQSTAVGQDGGELERKFIVRNITCNDGSKSGYRHQH